MDEYQNKNQQITPINLYKILFQKQKKYSIGHHIRNLKNKIGEILSYKQKDIDIFNPISNNNKLKIEKIYKKIKSLKSANKYNNYSYNNLSPKTFISNNKKYEKIFSRPFSQYTTNIGLSKNNSCPFLKNTPKGRPFSQINKNSELISDNIFSNNISKIIKNEDKLKYNLMKYQPLLINKKNKKKRSFSALLFKNNTQNLLNNSKMKKLLKQEKQVKKKKKELKGRLLTALSKHIVANKDTYSEYNYLFKDEEYSEDSKLNEEEIHKKSKQKKIFYYINQHPEIFSKTRPPFRYEDYYCSPLEFLIKYFSKDELDILKSSPEYFGLDKLPFKNSDFEYHPSLLSKLKGEEKNSDKSIKFDKIVNYKTKKIDLKHEYNKLKKIFKERKKNKIKRELIKGRDFVSHYERDIEPDEGTVQYFERKYIKYLNNKEKRMEKKINSIQFKKRRFEYLKNERTKKLEIEKNVQKITNPVINIIRQNYAHSNSMGI